ncbi:cyclin Ccl1p [[Candida] railenensis]|uniref:Cyclin Ccl1p n=1 Tax=[Candida] railenensis TaxID=45579 RepID=A0A9P0VXD0_9ASCO|nr:cyclin Ccl1p [[Candida] railenensis]
MAVIKQETTSEKLRGERNGSDTFSKGSTEDTSDQSKPDTPAPKPYVSNDDLYRRSSQYKLWSYTSATLLQIRQDVYKEGVKLAKERLSETKQNLIRDSTPEVVELLKSHEFSVDSLLDPPNLTEENKFLTYYSKILLNTGDFFRMPTQVKATAASFFKKFYLINSALEYHPKSVLYTCLFLAAKSENYFMSIESFASKLPNTEPKDVLDLEFIVLKSLKFTLLVHHPFRPLYGLFLDTQAVLLYPSPMMYDVNVDTLGGLYDKAKKWLVDYAIISDVELLFTPPQIALAAMYDTDKRITDKYLKRKFSDTNEYDQLVHTIVKCIRKAKDVEIPSKDESKLIDKKLFFVLHPERLLKKKTKQVNNAAAPTDAIPQPTSSNENSTAVATPVTPAAPLSI